MLGTKLCVERAGKYRSILTIPRRFNSESPGQWGDTIHSIHSVGFVAVGSCWVGDTDPSHPVWMGNLASPTFLPVGLLLLDFNGPMGELTCPGSTPGKLHSYGDLVFPPKHSREPRSWETHSYCTGWENNSGRRAGIRRGQLPPAQHFQFLSPSALLARLPLKALCE